MPFSRGGSSLLLRKVTNVSSVHPSGEWFHRLGEFPALLNWPRCALPKRSRKMQVHTIHTSALGSLLGNNNNNLFLFIFLIFICTFVLIPFPHTVLTGEQGRPRERVRLEVIVDVHRDARVGSLDMSRDRKLRRISGAAARDGDLRARDVELRRGARIVQRNLLDAEEVVATRERGRDVGRVVA